MFNQVWHKQNSTELIHTDIYLFIYLFINIYTINMKTPRVVESTTRSNQVNEPHQVAVAICLIFTVILLQKVTFPMKPSIPRPLLSNSVPLQTSKCSCDSCTSLSQHLQVRFSFQDLLAFIFTFANDLALYLMYTLAFGKGNVWR